METTGNLSINNHSFVTELGKLKNLQDDIPETIDIKDIKEKTGLFKLFEHRVTGEEINGLIGEVENMFVSQNEMNIKFLEEFNQVYKVFNKLDTDYIHGILIAVNDAAEASKQAKIAWEETQATINTQKKIVEKLKVFKEDVDVDAVSRLLDFSEKTGEDIASLKDFCGATNQNIKYLNDFKELVETNDHYYEIDAIWYKQEKLYQLLEENKSILEKQQYSLKELQNKFANELHKLEKIIHLSEVDIIWDKACKNTEDIKKVSDDQIMISKANEEANTKLMGLIDGNMSRIDELSTTQERIEIEAASKFKNAIGAINDLDDKSKIAFKDIESIRSYNIKQEEEVNKKIIDLKAKNVELNNEIELQKRKNKKTCLIMYVSIGVLAALTVASYVLNIIGIF